MKCIEKNSKSIKTQKTKKTANVNRQVDKDTQWAGLFNSLKKFSDDFMNLREQPELQKRHRIKLAKGKSS